MYLNIYETAKLKAVWSFSVLRMEVFVVGTFIFVFT